MGRVKGRLLSPGWVLLHLVFLAAVVATGWLGWWQWERAHDAGGSFQNLGYALQWPLFGAFTLFLWYQVLRMSLGGADQEAAEPVMDPTLADAVPDTFGDDGSGEAEQPPPEPAKNTAEKSESERPRRSPVPERAPSVTEEEDPQLAEYNRYLAELNAAESRRR